MPQTGAIARPQLVLASSSPQRHTLLRRLGIEPTLSPSNFDESARPDEEPGDLVERLAIGKASAVAAGKNLTIGADTMVLIDGEALGKAADAEIAATMLRRLSGRPHEVATGVAVVCNGHTTSSVTRTTVWFRKLSEDDLAWYLDSGEWVDKAGAYAIQGLGGLLVDRIEGDYNNVVGLPVGELDRLLSSFGRPLRTWMAGG